MFLVLGLEQADPERTTPEPLLGEQPRERGHSLELGPLGWRERDLRQRVRSRGAGVGRRVGADQRHRLVVAERGERGGECKRRRAAAVVVAVVVLVDVVVAPPDEPPQEALASATVPSRRAVPIRCVRLIRLSGRV